MRSARFPLLILAGAFLLSGCATYRMHPDFKKRQPEIHSVAVMPPDFEVFKVSFKGDKDPMHDLTPTTTKFIQEEIIRQLTDKGYAVTAMDFSEETLAPRPDLRTAWHTIKELYAKTLADIMKGRQKKFTYTLGSDVNILADHAGTDVLVLVRGEGLKKTGGEVAREVLMSAIFGTPFLPSQTILMLAVVDGNTGEILWLHNNINIKADPAIDSHMQSIVRSILGPFPKSSTKQNEEKPQRQKSHPPYETSVTPAPSQAPVPPGR